MGLMEDSREQNKREKIVIKIWTEALLKSLPEGIKENIVKGAEDYFGGVFPFSTFRKKKLEATFKAIASAADGDENILFIKNAFEESLDDAKAYGFTDEVVEALLGVVEPVHAKLLVWIGIRAQRGQSHPKDRMLFNNLKSFGDEDMLLFARLWRFANNGGMDEKGLLVCDTGEAEHKEIAEKFASFGLLRRSGIIDGNYSSTTISVIFDDYAQTLGETLWKIYKDKIDEERDRRDFRNSDEVEKSGGF